MKCPNATADGEVSSSRFGTSLDGPVEAEVNKSPFAQGLEEYAVTADGGTTLCNRSNTRVSRSGHFSEFYEVLVAGLDAQKQGPDAVYEKSILIRIRISVAYLKRLIGCVFVRIQY
jgi:hypothetical protein